jgi:endonuclease-3 related protein
VSSRIRRLYDLLLREYGTQGWWPVLSRSGRRGFDDRGYHPGLRRIPQRPAERFEVVLGAILTQNTAWTNVETCLSTLFASAIRMPADILSCGTSRLGALIRSSGYYNEKAKKLAAAAVLFSAPGALSGRRPPSRDTLLATWGIGPETADSILLYAFHVPVFVVDAYTRRILARVGLIGGRESHAEIQGLFQAALPRDPAVFNEYHALLVAHAKLACRASPLCDPCPLRACRYRTLGES